MILLRPWFLILLLIPFVIVHTKKSGRIGAWKKICDEHLLPHLSVKIQGRKNTFYRWYLTALWVWLVVAISGPAILQKQNETFSEKKAVVAVLDLSPAMTESLLNEARFKLFDFLKTTQADVGFVISDAKAYTVVPITPDKAIIQQVLPTIDLSVSPVTGSAPEKGLQRAEELLKQAGYTQGQILLLTAGIMDADALEKTAQKTTYPIAILGFGESAPHPVAWKKDFWKDSKGVPYKASLDARRLNKIGFYQKSVLDNRDLEKITQQKGTMESTQQLGESYQDLGAWMVLFVLPFAAWLFRKGILLGCVLLIFSSPASASWFMRQEQEVYALQQQGIQAYRQKDFEQAEQFFAAAEDTYNQANARAMQHDYAGAIELYEQELLAHPDNEDARFNRDYLKQLLQQNPQPEENSSQQKDKDSSKDQNEKSQQQQGQGEQAQQEASKDQQQEQSQEQQGDSQQENTSSSSGENSAEQQTQNSTSEQTSNEENKEDSKSEEIAEQGAFEAPASPDSSAQFEKQQQQQWLGKIEPDVSGLLRYRLHKQAQEAP